MLVKSQGIVIKSTRYSESSAIVKIYTQGYGMTAFLIQGMYSKKSGLKPALFQPLQVLELDFYFKENKNLLKVKEARSAFVLNHLHFEMKRSTIAMVISELIYKCIQEEEENKEMYDFLVSSIHILDNPSKDSNHFLLFFMLHFSRYLGFFPANSFSDDLPNFDLYEGRFKSDMGINTFLLDTQSSFLLNQIINTNIGEYDSIQIPQIERLKLIEYLIDYYKIHISGFHKLSSFEVIKGLFLK
ncbi:MAG: DNA repair protein RecO [Bacteroidetes bacterium]|jgi:DNA repair protein RecO (recombination protein O)|nr:DNA repair protein RecO [Bacteroidota bacterium]MBT5528760.1 DNA repair protein RecO [Cytophagia bacterium]MBT3422102.1 DNA repair protein RecO [Bacteroidota bacterium]MBT3935917.1 DNA repair protein RecO [Bacteroidota bacterium]MBT4339631.1 DNA repair protein RecO [Bacteroidota bacterium]